MQLEGCLTLAAELAIRTCRLRGLSCAKVLPITRVSSGLGVFDTIVMFGNNFGLMGGYRRARWLLRRFHAMTSDKGRILAQTHDPHQTKVPAHLKYHARNRRRGWMRVELGIRVRYKGHATPWLDFLLVSNEKMEGIVKGTGITLSTAFRTCTNPCSSPHHRPNPSSPFSATRALEGRKLRLTHPLSTPHPRPVAPGGNRHLKLPADPGQVDA